MVGTPKQAASKAKGPAVAVGATVAGVTGGLVLKNRLPRKTVLGVRVPRSISASDVDVKAIAKTSKSMSKDMECAGDQAERIGKILS